MLHNDPVFSRKVHDVSHGGNGSIRKIPRDYILFDPHDLIELNDELKRHHSAAKPFVGVRAPFLLGVHHSVRWGQHLLLLISFYTIRNIMMVRDDDVHTQVLGMLHRFEG